ncbi:uncharacterized protein [Epargyreus clarus]|uniref:uncharacterized protein n=1 Tax=Epargyreus clarus TaxID=520877 RepID=UPI003C2DC506
MMFSDEEIKESSLMRPGDEIISIREVYLSDKYDKKDLGFSSESLLSNSGRNDLDTPRFLRDGFFPEGLDQQQARFAWTEEDGNIAALVSEPGFGTTGQTTFGKDLDIALRSELKEADSSSSVFQYTNRNGMIFTRKPYVEQQAVTSTTSGNPCTSTSTERSKTSKSTCKVDKADPRSRFHYVKFVKRHGRTVKLWECGICSREFQHQYTLMRHLPTHTDERNFHCDVCAKSFRQLSTLSQHRAIHSAERPYSCEVCNKTFNRVSTLISHRKTHSDEKPYKCHICPKGFHQKGNLRNHLFTHTNERPYRCNICLKGFNQQSNLVCHKNKAHPEESGPNPPKVRIPSSSSRQSIENKDEPLDSRQSDCEVTSLTGPYPPGSSGSWTKPSNWDVSKCLETGDPWSSDWGAISNGVIVDAIKTYHMRIALATKQTPFALLKSDSGAPVLVKVVDTNVPGGKQMLVPATAEDLRVGGKIVLKDDGSPSTEVSTSEVGSAVQIRVPVVATVVPRIRPGGRLHLAVEEPHHAYHTTLSTEMGEVKLEPCSLTMGSPTTDPETLNGPSNYQDNCRPGSGISSSCSLPPPAPSPPLDLIAMDLFEPMEGIPMGPQITAVDDVDGGPPSDDSDVLIGKFEEGIPLSDSD